MPYRVINGYFHLFYRSERFVGSRPDGDSCWFLPDDPDLLTGLGGRSVEFNGGGFAQLRFEGIDALELHFPGSDHQHEDETVEARNFVLGEIGFGDIEYAPNDDIPTYVRDATPDSVRGHILTRTIDPHGRPVAFVYVGESAENDGDEVFLDEEGMDESINADLMLNGHVYPGFYTRRTSAPPEEQGGLPGDLRERLTEHVIEAFNAGDGVWAVDSSMESPRIRNREELMELAIWPKLYRRLAKFFRDPDEGANPDVADFPAWLTAAGEDRNDQIFILTTGELATLNDILEVNEVWKDPSSWIMPLRALFGKKEED